MTNEEKHLEFFGCERETQKTQGFIGEFSRQDFMVFKTDGQNVQILLLPQAETGGNNFLALTCPFKSNCVTVCEYSSLLILNISDRQRSTHRDLYLTKKTRKITQRIQRFLTLIPFP